MNIPFHIERGFVETLISFCGRGRQRGDWNVLKIYSIFFFFHAVDGNVNSLTWPRAPSAVSRWKHFKWIFDSFHRAKIEAETIFTWVSDFWKRWLKCFGSTWTKTKKAAKYKRWLNKESWCCSSACFCSSFNWRRQVESRDETDFNNAKYGGDKWNGSLPNRIECIMHDCSLKFHILHRSSHCC